MTTANTCEHHPVEIGEGRTPISNMHETGRYNRAAHGGIVVHQRCRSCGWLRSVRRNGGHEEPTIWVRPATGRQLRALALLALALRGVLVDSYYRGDRFGWEVALRDCDLPSHMSRGQADRLLRRHEDQYARMYHLHPAEVYRWTQREIGAG